jgi:hypothetical protein
MFHCDSLLNPPEKVSSAPTGYYEMPLNIQKGYFIIDVTDQISSRSSSTVKRKVW